MIKMYQERKKLVARILSDLGKTIFAVGLATSFFDKYSGLLKTTLLIIFIFLLLLSIFIQPPAKKGE